YPPLYYALGFLSYRARGGPLLARLFAVRLISVFLGALAAALAFLAALRLLGDLRSAIMAGALFALQPQLAFLSGVVNSDAALFACAAGALWAIGALRNNPGSRAALVGLAIAGVLGVLSKPTFMVHLPALGLLAVAAGGWRRAASWIEAALALL